MSDEAAPLPPDPEALKQAARRVHDRRVAWIAEGEELEEARRQAILDLREVGIAWTEIGRIFDVSPQAAMYACGAATRTPKKAPAKKPRRKAAPKAG